MINYWAVLVCGVVSMVVGSVWYGPLFGKKWKEIIGVSEKPTGMGKLYFTQFVLSLVQVYVLAHFVSAWDGKGVVTALWIWLGFLMPMAAGASMWNNDSSKIAWSRFLIQAGYNLVLFVIFGLILSAWR